MKKRNLNDTQPANKKKIQKLLSLMKNQKLQTSISALMDMPDEWDTALMDPTAWLRDRGVRLPEGLEAVITKEVSISKPIDVIFGMPGPDWIPYQIKLTNCRTYWISTRDKDGKITGIRQETVCFGFEFVLDPLPGWPGPSPV